MNITVNIERLIFEGVSLAPWQRPLLQAAVEAELARLLAEGGVGGGLAAGWAVPSLPAGAIQLPGDGDPVAMGAQIAQAVYGGMSR
jgi:hypothetical protein